MKIMRKMIIALSLLLSTGITIAQKNKEVKPNAPINWYLKDPKKDKVYGVGAEKAYELLKGKTAKEIIVAVIDSGVETDHPDLKDVIWVNKGEIPNNGIDDDKNGYIDDVHGWSFLGGAGGDVDNEALELARMVRSEKNYFAGKTASDVPASDKERYDKYVKLKAELDQENAKNQQQYQGVMMMAGYINNVKAASNGVFDKKTNKAYVPKDEMETKIKKRIGPIMLIYPPATLDKEINNATETFGNLIKMNNMDVDSVRRVLVGDNPQDMTERYYGCNRYEGPDAFHGTHVAGFSRKKKPGTWSHGDIEERALKGIFSSSEISKIYYGNWLRDYSSVITGVSVGFDYEDRLRIDKNPFKENEVIKKYRKNFSIKLSQKSWVKVVGLLAAKEFVYNTKEKPSENILKHKEEFTSEFGEPTINILGIYRPEEHIDNPKGILDESILSHPDLIDPIRFTYEKSNGPNGVRKLYPEALAKSLEINPNTMMKRYIKEDIDELRPSSFTYFSEQLKLAKKHGKTNKGFRHFGAAMHVLEDFFAHSNFVEVSLIKHGNTKVNPWVDLSPEVKAIIDPEDKAKKIPIVTGNFGQLDIIASLAPKIAVEFFSLGYQEYKKLLEGERTLIDELIFIVLDDYIQKEEGMPDNQKESIVGIGGYKELKSYYKKYLDLIDFIRHEEKKPGTGIIITYSKMTLDFISQTVSLLPNLVINTILSSLSDAVKIRQTKTTIIGTNPSHSQLAKDSHEHPLIDLAGYLAFLTVGKIGEDMANCWKTGVPKIETIIETAKNRYFVHPCFTNWADNEIKKWVKNNKSKVKQVEGNTPFHVHGLEVYDTFKEFLNKSEFFKDLNITI